MCRSTVKDNYLNMYLLCKISCTSWSSVSVDARIIRRCIAKYFGPQREGAFRPNQLTVVRTHHYIIGKKGILRCSYIKEYISTFMFSWRLLCSSELLHCEGRVLCVASNLKAAIFIDAVDFTTGATLCFFGKIAKILGVSMFSEAEDLATGDKICQILGV